MKGRNLSAARRAGLAGHRCPPQTAYVLNSGSGTVTPISTRTSTAGPAIPVGQDPMAIAITPDSKTVYVVNNGYDTDDYLGWVTPISTHTGTAGPAISVEDYPVAIAITPEG
jgi:YVTN family beta-propeller protein